MSAFRVGDRVMCTCGGGAACTVQGRVVGIDGDGSTRVSCDNGEEVTWLAKHLALGAPTSPVAVAPTLETATGADLDRVARDMLKVYRVPGTTDADFRRDLLEMAPSGAGPAFQVSSGNGTRFDGGELQVLSDMCGATNAEWSEALAQINEKHKALDTVRKFLGSHSFASCSLACNRELREVMAVVLRALNAERGDTW